MHRIQGENVDVSSGVNLFSDNPPYTVATPAWCNAVQEEIMNVIVNAGLPVLDENADQLYRNQLWTAIQSMIQGWDYIVHNQTTFNNLFERTGANAYQIKSDYGNVLFKQAVGGYAVSGILSGGDTWGDISTNACKHIEFMNDAYINFGALPGNLTVNTDDCYLKNVNIQGNGSSGAITESFELGANRVTFDNCKCSNRLSSVDMVGFQGSGTAVHNITSKYINCSAYILDGTDKLYGFKDCYNLTACLAYDIDSTGDDAYGIYNCLHLTNCYVTDIDTSSGTAYGFDSCTYLDSSNYSDEANTQTPAAGCLDDGTPFYKKIIEIGNWDMDSTANISIAHGLDWTKIRNINVLIIQDIDAAPWNIPYRYCFESQTGGGGSYYIDSTNIVLQRVAGGFFDGVLFDDTPYDRGWITVEYID